MDFDIGNIIYIILMLIAVVASATRKKKKPAAKPVTPPQNTKLKGLLDLLSDELILKEEPEQVAAEIMEPEAEVIPEEQVNYSYEEAALEPEHDPDSEGISVFDNMEDDEEFEDGEYAIYHAEGDTDESEIYKSIFEEEGKNASSETIIELIDTDKLKYADLSQLIENFDLETAVIYSEIINRKEY